jgi:hypothetical protein
VAVRRPATDLARLARRLVRLLAVLGATGSIVACVAPGTSGDGSGQGVSHEVLARGDQVPATMEGGEAMRVFVSAAAFREAWQALVGESPPAPGFDRHRVVWLRGGRRPTAGHRLRVESVRRDSGALVIRHVEQRPGEGCLAATVVTYPWLLVRVPAGDARIETRRRVESVDCE